MPQLRYLLAGALVLYAGFKIYKKKQHRDFHARVKASKPGVVYLYTGDRFLEDAPSFSAWAVKLEAFLRVHKIPYVVEFVSDFTLSPTETIPFIGLNGKLVGDSQLCIEHIARELKIPLDAHLTAEQNAVSLAFHRLVERDLFWQVYRTLIVDNMVKHGAPLAKHLSSTKRFLMTKLFFPKYRKIVIEKLNASGLGDQTDDRYQEELQADFCALETLLGTKKFLFGDQISMLDIEVFAVLNFVLAIRPALVVNTNGVNTLYSSKTLSEYVLRLRAELFPDLAKIVPSTTPTQEFIAA